MGDFSETEPLAKAAGAKQAGDAEPVLSPEEARERSDSLDMVQASYGWLNDQVQDRLNAFGSEIKEHADKGWLVEFLVTALEIAVTAGTNGVGAHLIHVFKKALANAPAAEEIVKTGISEGSKVAVTTGIGAVVKAFGSGSDADKEKLADAFTTSQKAAARFALMSHQKNFIHSYRHQVRTVAEARAVEAKVDQGGLEEVAEQYVAKTRDAWVTLLAQRKFGTKQDAGGAPTTNMAGDAERDQQRSLDPKHTPATSPQYSDATLGGAEGGLFVRASLPDPVKAPDEHGVVSFAFLNGVNDPVRRSYQGRYLNEMHIPRHIRADVNGDFEDFEVSVDEEGASSWITEKQGAWLHAKGASTGKLGGVDAGLQLLLTELKPTRIEGG